MNGKRQHNSVDYVNLGERARIEKGAYFEIINDKPIYIGDDTIIHSGAVIYSGCIIGKKCRIGHNTVIRENTVIGDHTFFGGCGTCEGNTTIGHHVGIHSNNHVTAFTKIGNYVFFGPGCIETNDNRIAFKREGHGKDLRGQTFGDGVRVGGGTTFLPGITVGEHAFIGAGSLVTRDIPARKLAYGRPARVVGDAPDNPIIECDDCKVEAV